MNIDKILHNHQWEFIPWHHAQETVKDIRVMWGFKPTTARLLTWPEDNSKLKKSAVPIMGFSALPHRLAIPNINFCSHSTAGCRQFCINHAGNGAYPAVQRGRGWKSELLARHPNVWFTLLWRELELARKRYADGFICRLNVFTDVAWERTLPSDFWTHFTEVKFQDYTKQWERTDFPSNYRVVFSASERTFDAAMQMMLMRGERVAVVFDLPKTAAMPSEWHGMPLVDGDVDDNLWERPAGHLIGLRAKGKLRRTNSLFKRKLDDQ